MAMRIAIVNIGSIVSGELDQPRAAGDTIVTEGDRIVGVGTASARDVEACDVVIDADKAAAIPGLIDSHVHITFGDYTPRQKTVGFLESYIHGGTHTSINASEVHVPGRPKDPEGVKALAVAAMKSFEHYRPGGMRVCAGSVILEPGLVERDLEELARHGVWFFTRHDALEAFLRPSGPRFPLALCLLREAGGRRRERAERRS